MNEMQALLSQINEAREAEREAKSKRIALENELLIRVDHRFTEQGTARYDGFSVRQEHTRKVDRAKLVAVALEHGITNQLESLFRFKAEVDSRGWAKASEETKAILSVAIETKPARPVITIK